MTDWELAANAIAADFAHGHDDLTEDCALCVAEYEAVTALGESLHVTEKE